ETEGEDEVEAGLQGAVVLAQVQHHAHLLGADGLHRGERREHQQGDEHYAPQVLAGPFQRFSDAVFEFFHGSPFCLWRIPPLNAVGRMSGNGTAPYAGAAEGAKVTLPGWGPALGWSRDPGLGARLCEASFHPGD